MENGVNRVKKKSSRMILVINGLDNNPLVGIVRFWRFGGLFFYWLYWLNSRFNPLLVIEDLLTSVISLAVE